jgi:hypothetical protein
MAQEARVEDSVVRDPSHARQHIPQCVDPARLCQVDHQHRALGRSQLQQPRLGRQRVEAGGLQVKAETPLVGDQPTHGLTGFLGRCHKAELHGPSGPSGRSDRFS